MCLKLPPKVQWKNPRRYYSPWHSTHVALNTSHNDSMCSERGEIYSWHHIRYEATSSFMQQYWFHQWVLTEWTSLAWVWRMFDFPKGFATSAEAASLTQMPDSTKSRNSPNLSQRHTYNPSEKSMLVKPSLLLQDTIRPTAPTEHSIHRERQLDQPESTIEVLEKRIMARPPHC